MKFYVSCQFQINEPAAAPVAKSMFKIQITMGINSFCVVGRGVVSVCART